LAATNACGPGSSGQSIGLKICFQPLRLFRLNCSITKIIITCFYLSMYLVNMSLTTIWSLSTVYHCYECQHEDDCSDHVEVVWKAVRQDVKWRLSLGSFKVVSHWRSSLESCKSGSEGNLPLHPLLYKPG